MNRKKNRGDTVEKHLEIGRESNETLKAITKAINNELDDKYYEWQVFEASINFFEKQLKAMNRDQKLQIMKPTQEGQK